ncbi:MAG TPA: heme-binding domain-containing protein [Candidatus Binataceae bacterium]
MQHIEQSHPLGIYIFLVQFHSLDGELGRHRTRHGESFSSLAGRIIVWLSAVRMLKIVEILLKAPRGTIIRVMHATLLVQGKFMLHGLISDIGWIRRGCRLAVCAGALLWVVMAFAGCSSSSTAPETERSGPAAGFATDPQVNEILANSCFDCHSDRGSGSWSAKFAPSYLFGGNKGRDALNFSNWASADPKQRSAMASLIGAVVESGSMPPGDYVFFHPSAGLDDDQKKLLLQWTEQQKLLPAH